MTLHEVHAPAFTVVPAAQRAHAEHGWLDTYYSFSFADYVDPANERWGALRVFNDDTIAPGAGFPPHPHRDMEIVTYVLEGELAHRDSLGNEGVLGPGGVQFMSAGTGVRHSESNHSAQRRLHLVQMWVLPKHLGTPPSYGQMSFEAGERRNRWLDVASGEGTVGTPIRLGQDATLRVAGLHDGSVEHRFAPGRYGFLFVGAGAVTANGIALAAGDAVKLYDAASLQTAGTGELVLWDLPEEAA